MPPDRAMLPNGLLEFREGLLEEDRDVAYRLFFCDDPLPDRNEGLVYRGTTLTDRRCLPHRALEVRIGPNIGLALALGRV